MFFPHPRDNESSEPTDPIRPLFKLYYKPGERRMGAESWHRGIKEKEGYLRNMITSILSSASLPDDFLEDENIELIE